MDASDIYGSKDSVAKSLRTFNGGRLNVTVINGNEYLPAGSEALCGTSSSNEFCFRSGDVRINQTPTLVVLTNTFFRLHNRIAKLLAQQNPHWNDETLYQEGRRIVIAIKQHITYQYWLPPVLGNAYMERRNMLPKKSGFAKYDPDVDVRTINSFSASGFRYSHSTIQGEIK